MPRQGTRTFLVLLLVQKETTRLKHFRNTERMHDFLYQKQTNKQTNNTSLINKSLWVMIHSFAIYVYIYYYELFASLVARSCHILSLLLQGEIAHLSTCLFFANGENIRTLWTAPQNPSSCLIVQRMNLVLAALDVVVVDDDDGGNTSLQLR